MEGILSKIKMENLNIFATFLVKDITTCIRKIKFPDKLKTAFELLLSKTKPIIVGIIYRHETKQVLWRFLIKTCLK